MIDIGGMIQIYEPGESPNPRQVPSKPYEDD